MLRLQNMIKEETCFTRSLMSSSLKVVIDIICFCLANSSSFCFRFFSKARLALSLGSSKSSLITIVSTKCLERKIDEQKLYCVCNVLLLSTSNDQEYLKPFPSSGFFPCSWFMLHNDVGVQFQLTSYQSMIIVINFTKEQSTSF